LALPASIGAPTVDVRSGEIAGSCGALCGPFRDLIAEIAVGAFGRMSVCLANFHEPNELLSLSLPPYLSVCVRKRLHLTQWDVPTGYRPLSRLVYRRPAKIVSWPLEDMCLDGMANSGAFCAEFRALNIDEYVGQCQEKRKRIALFTAGRTGQTHSYRTFAAKFCHVNFILEFRQIAAAPGPGGPTSA
jgi:hypothetical protein